MTKGFRVSLYLNAMLLGALVTTIYLEYKARRELALTLGIQSISPSPHKGDLWSNYPQSTNVEDRR